MDTEAGGGKAVVILSKPNGTNGPDKRVFVDDACCNDAYSADISWPPFFSAGFYNIYRKVENASRYKLLASVEGTFFVDRSVLYGSRYRYKIVAVCPGCCKTVCELDVVIP